MSRFPDTAVLDQLMEPLGQCFTPDVARRIVSLRASPEVQARLDELADKSSGGTLTPEEQKLYESCVRTINFIGVLQAQARAQLAASHG